MTAAKCAVALGFRFRTTGWSHLFQGGSAMPCSVFHFCIVPISNYPIKSANEVKLMLEVKHSSYIIFCHLALKCHI